jgi:hypothetical protein
MQERSVQKWFSCSFIIKISFDVRLDAFEEKAVKNKNERKYTIASS